MPMQRPKMKSTSSKLPKNAMRERQGKLIATRNQAIRKDKNYGKKPSAHSSSKKAMFQAAARKRSY